MLFHWSKGLTFLQKLLCVVLVNIIALSSFYITEKIMDCYTGTVLSRRVPIWDKNVRYPVCFTTGNLSNLTILCNGLLEKPVFGHHRGMAMYAYMSDNLWYTLDESMFYTFPNLQILHLAHNRISLVSSNAFHGLGNLQVLNLADNNITKLNNETFQDLNELKILHLSRNRIVHLGDSIFSGLLKLRKLWLDYNCIVDISPVLFTDLIHIETLHLEHNHITEIRNDTFIHLANESGALYLQYNRIAHISKWAFATSIAIRTLNLMGNPLACKEFGHIRVDIEDRRLPIRNLCSSSSTLNAMVSKQNRLKRNTTGDNSTSGSTQQYNTSSTNSTGQSTTQPTVSTNATPTASTNATPTVSTNATGNNTCNNVTCRNGLVCKNVDGIFRCQYDEDDIPEPPNYWNILPYFIPGAAFIVLSSWLVYKRAKKFTAMDPNLVSLIEKAAGDKNRTQKKKGACKKQLSRKKPKSLKRSLARKQKGSTKSKNHGRCKKKK